MLTLVDIKKAINDKLKSKWSYKIYGNEVKEGFDRPSFFTQLLPIGSNYETTNYDSNKIIAKITYFPKTHTDLDNMKMAHELKLLFGMKLKVKDRQLTLYDIRIDFAGENNEVLQFSFDLNYFDEISKVTEKHDMMEELNYKQRGE